MRTTPHMTEPGRRARLWLLAVVTTVLMAASACTGGGPGSPEPSASADPAQALADYADCMAENGVDMPDRGAVGQVGEGAEGEDPLEDPDFADANAACEDLLGGVVFSDGEAEELDPEVLDAMLAYAQCMREEGIDMPDPAGGGLVVEADGAGFDPESEEFQRADDKCGHLLADVPVDEEGSP